MEVTEQYANLTERKAKIILREGQGLRMLHDNFDTDWKPGDEPHGTMTFTDVMPPEDLIAKKRNEARARAIQAIKGNAGASPWGQILNDMAIAEGWIEPI